MGLKKESIVNMKKGEQTRERLLKCAEKAFAEKGYYETQVSDIVKMAHVAKGTIYQYFENKRELFITLLERYAQDWERIIALDMKDFIGEKPGSFYAKQFLYHRISRTAAFFKENEDRTNIILRIGVGVNEEFDEVMKIFEGKILKVITHDIDMAQRQGHIPPDINIEITGNAVLGAILRLSYYFYVVNRKNLQKFEKIGIIDEAVKLVSNTLRMS